MPEVSAKQLEVMVPIEARKYIPVPIAEVMLDWSVVPKSTSRPQEIPESEEAPNPALAKIDVLVVAIHKETIAHYQTIAVQAGLDVGFFEIEIFSTMRAVLEETLRPVLIMDMGAASTKLYVVERGMVRASHTINRGAQDITGTLAKSLSITNERAEIRKREEGLLSSDKQFSDVILLTLDYIFAEANNALLAYEKKYNQAVSKVYMVGGGAALKGIAEVAKNNLKTEAELGSPFNKVAAPAFLENVLRATGPEFAVAIGLALRRLAEEG